MLETVAGWNEDIAEGVFAVEETVDRTTTAFISPGARYAFNLPNDTQLVVGLGVPIGLTSDSPDYDDAVFHISFVRQTEMFLRRDITKHGRAGTSSSSPRRWRW